MGASFIDRLGGAILFPFFTLYVTAHFNVGMRHAGIIFAIFAVSNQIGSFIGGGLTDKIGRKSMVIFGIVSSGLTSIWMGYIDDLQVFYLAAAVSGLLDAAGGPAQQAMVADLLPEKQRADGYGIWRVLSNLAVTFGPAIGALVAGINFRLLFIGDALTSFITALIVYRVLPETKPEGDKDRPAETFGKTFLGYFRVLRDRPYIAFAVIGILANTVYIQMNSTLAVYMRDSHGFPIQYLGYILSMNAAMVVVFQFWITRITSKHPPLIMMALGTALYAIGFGMYGFIHGIWLFALAMVILTIGEMIVIPVSQALVAKFAPEDMRGRYMAVYGFAWGVPFAVGPLLAGILMDQYNPDWVWYACGILGSIAALGYLALQRRAKHRFNHESAVESQPA